ncbi:hypothetical protein [Georgenia thermotolerans]|uniref:Uncharacterized protein n=1 Tax=Georgenia thermotolerans TaxID=527326 RepID=A0A7J5USF4_9MICO|nr:hypothetical protein [Georgenia thermotolerans]KAE8764763.1 hypothetical protein GB883_07260 [Georgenia thermotolerans]
MTPLVLLLAASPSPSPAPRELQPWDVSPGIEGFFWGFFILAVLAIPLFLSFTKHMRRVDHNARLREAEEARRAEAQGDRREDDGAPEGRVIEGRAVDGGAGEGRGTTPVSPPDAPDVPRQPL